jgi:hypothetical protein
MERPIRLGKIHTLRAARRAVVRITQAVLEGKLEPRIANSAIYGMQTAGRFLEAEVFEGRLESLEQRAGLTRSGRPCSTSVVGHA